MLMQTSRNGYFFVLDRETGKNLLSVPYGPVNWATGLDKDGQPIPNPDKEPKRDGRLVAPDEGGLTNYRSPSFDPKTGLFVVDSHPSYGIYFAKQEDGTFGWAGADYDVWSKAVLEAIDYQTGQIKWQHYLGPNGSGAGVLTTDSGICFTGDSRGNIIALKTADGKTLWHAGTGANMQTSPSTYQIDGRQYVLAGSGGVLFAWALPESE
jgi:alcohol dehydrogenase (cytochrome c)